MSHLPSLMLIYYPLEPMLIGRVAKSPRKDLLSETLLYASHQYVNIKFPYSYYYELTSHHQAPPIRHLDKHCYSYLQITFDMSPQMEIRD